MQKAINVMAVASFIVSAVVVAGAANIYLRRDAIRAEATERLTEMVTEAVSGAVGDLPDLMGGGPAAPSSPAGSGFPVPF